LLKPLDSETENEFSVRAHGELLDSMPDTDERNAAIFSAWRKHKGETELEKRATEKYGADCVQIRDVPVFAEHETVGRDGKPVRYGRDELLAICDRCNNRISDTGDFAALTFGHTPTKEEKLAGVEQPMVAGYAGPFRVGMIGKDNPRFAIFADENHYRDTAAQARKSPRRSPEVWLHPRIDQRFMDPIALLGAETPRLDLGMRYAKFGELEVERYTADAPGACNTFVPGPVNTAKRKERYEEPQITDKEPSMISPEDIQQIVAAVMQTKAMQWAAQEAEKAASPGAPEPGVPGAPPAVPPEKPPVDMNAAPEVDPDGDETKKKEPPMQYSKAEQDLVARYSKQAEENAALKQRLEALEIAKRDTERKSRLQTLRYSRAFDFEEEVTRCSKLNDEGFNDHCTVIEKHYPKIEADVSFTAGGTFPPAEAEREQYAKEAENVGKATAWVLTERQAGRQPTIEEAYAKFGVKL